MTGRHISVAAPSRGRYPFTPCCSCGWVGRGYVAEHAAQLMADDHMEAESDPYNRVVFVQGHRHSEPVCTWPDCRTYLTRSQMAALPHA